eukprot:g47745.t1
MRCKIYWMLTCRLLCCVLSLWNLVFGQIHYSIPEELQLGAFVGNVAEDLGLDVKQLAARSFRIVSGPSKQYVDINLDTGILLVKQSIDREEICGPSLSCVLSLSGLLQNPLKLYPIAVEILDINDNTPSFLKKQLHLEISELSSPGTRFPLESANDPDVATNSVQTYELLPNNYFVLDVQMHDGEKLPVLVLQSSLDRETESSHSLTVIAKDGGIPVRSGTVQVLITVKDTNDNAPIFPQSVYRVSVLENAAAGTQVIKLNATDLDGGPNGAIAYSLSSYNSAKTREKFSVDSKTGEIKVRAKLDYEEYTVFEINIKAVDGGFHSMSGHCDVLVNIIDVNDNPPEVTLTTLTSTLSEDAPVGTVVALFSATDKDSGINGQVHCKIPIKLPFGLDSSLENYYGLIVQHPLDRENISKYDITVTCTDAGNPPLTSKNTIRVELSDINDNAPRFAQSLYRASVTENNDFGAPIFSISAFDPDIGRNARLKYSVLETQVHNASISTYVSINSETGAIFAQRSFDYEKLKSFQVQAQVMDSGSPPLASNVSVDVVILDQNDNVPVIVQPMAEFGSATVETISRFAEPGYLVAKVSATDADAGQNARLSYSIIQATHHNLLTISPETGEIWTIRRIASKDSTQQSLVILVKDNGKPSLSATVTIILSVVGDDTETFSSISGSSKDPRFGPDISLSLVIALGRFRYESCSTLQSTKKDFVTPNMCRSYTDKTYVRSDSLKKESTRMIDSECNSNSVYNEVLFLIDEVLLYDIASLYRKPGYRNINMKMDLGVQVRSSFKVATQVGKLIKKAYGMLAFIGQDLAALRNQQYFDWSNLNVQLFTNQELRDDGSNGEITYSLSSYCSAEAREKFAVNPKTGEIRVKGNLDYEENKAFEINIQATDGGPDAMSGHCDVLVNIIDVNDNPPEVKLTSLLSTISEDAPVGTVVALGEIWTIRRIASKDASKQRLVILVKDHGIPSFSATVTITLSVVGGDTERLSSVSGSSDVPESTPDLSISLVIAFG